MKKLKKMLPICTIEKIVSYTVHTKTRNELEPLGMSWNKLERAGTSWNHLERAGTRWSYQRLALERIRLVSCNGSSCFHMHRKENLRQTYNNTNTKSFVEYEILRRQHELEINGTLRISIQWTNSKTLSVSQWSANLSESWLTVTLYFKGHFLRFS